VREAASKIAAHPPKLSVGCLEPPEECQGRSASEEGREACPCSLCASFSGGRRRCSRLLAARLNVRGGAPF
jgi:hypothetical protein